MYLDVDHYLKLNLKYNPFSYLNNRELFDVTEERIDLKALTSQIKSKDSFCIEFFGRKGRGKSTLIQVLQAKYLAEVRFFQLKKRDEIYINETPDILIVDSFQLLSLKNRLRLLNQQKRLIICSHYKHNFLNFYRREFTHSVNFNNLIVDEEFLEKIVTRRIQLACFNKDKQLPKLKLSYLKELVNLHNNDLRSIQLKLYDFFLNPQKEFYEL